ncbi:MAG TPA: isoaspartyl peptidase/L-asparaginase, partial [Ferruginibacter sp.]|nr:isoaspartyl peptidase/L-asparaginase [Ferruginibacter sp.]
MNRKEFLRLSSMGLASLPLSPFTNHVAAKPLIISTWDSGMPVNAAGWKVLSARGSALDAVEAGARYIEDTVDCCVGLDGYPDRDGIVTLDACIMDDLANCGAVAGLEKIRHPISVARKVMEKTPHVLLVGQGAQQFALENGFTLEDGKLSPSAEKAYKQWLIKSE